MNAAEASADERKRRWFMEPPNELRQRSLRFRHEKAIFIWASFSGDWARLGRGKATLGGGTSGECRPLTLKVIEGIRHAQADASRRCRGPRPDGAGARPGPGPRRWPG